MTFDVFISHSSKDKLLADAVCAGLEARGIRCWVAPRDIIPGEEWTKSIVDAILNSKVFLLILTANSNASIQALKEVDLAVNHEKVVIPFRLEDIKPTGSMEYYLGSLHWLDALTKPVEKHIEKLANYIKHIIGYSKNEEHVFEKNYEKPIQNTEIIQKKSIFRNIKPVLKRSEKNRINLLIGVSVIIVGSIIFLIIKNMPYPLPQTPEITKTSIHFSTFTPDITLTPTIKPSATYSPTPTPTPTQIEVSLEMGQTTISPIDGMVMLAVPGGEFLMGSSDIIGAQNEHPQHIVYLSSFWIDETEVTNSMYSKCVESGKCTSPSSVYNGFTNETKYYGNPEFDNFPVIYVSWYQANDYCKWAGKQLPSEAQWEKAARGDNGFIYPWGDESPNPQNIENPESNLANFRAHNGLMAVGSFPEGASPYYALDMAGNVAEWVADWYDENYYSTSPLRNPSGPSNGIEKVERGGMWLLEAEDLRTSIRGRNSPDFTYHGLGFRCVLIP